jgi:glycosyltransferase involved in cell wall biosynthesis
MIAKDAEKTIGKTLESLKAFNEVVLYLNNCSDRTEEIAKSYSNVNVVHGEFLGFGPTKNQATTHATNDWILSLDSDECLTETFVDNLKNRELKDDTVYTILRTNHYKTRQIKHCWGDDVIVRLYNRSKTKFTDKKVHEKIIDDGLKKEMLEGIVEHYPYSTQTDFIVKLDRYSTIFAEDNVGKKSSSPLKAILNAHFSFFKTYFLKRGFLDGSAGLIIAFSHMATNFYKYMKLYEMNKELKK